MCSAIRLRQTAVCASRACRADGCCWVCFVPQVLAPEFEKPYTAQLQGFLQQEWAAGTVYPPKESVFRAFNSVPFDQVRPAPGAQARCRRRTIRRRPAGGVGYSRHRQLHCIKVSLALHLFTASSLLGLSACPACAAALHSAEALCNMHRVCVGSPVLSVSVKVQSQFACGLRLGLVHSADALCNMHRVPVGGSVLSVSIRIRSQIAPWAALWLSEWPQRTVSAGARVLHAAGASGDPGPGPLHQPRWAADAMPPCSP